jgi:hypothetical protein
MIGLEKKIPIMWMRFLDEYDRYIGFSKKKSILFYINFLYNFYLNLKYL